MIKLLKRLNKKEYLLIIISFILITFQVYLDLKLPDYMSEITRLVQSEGVKLNEVLTQGFYMLLCAFGSLISAIIVVFLTSNLSADFSFNLRKKIFKKVSTFSMEQIKDFSTSSLITRTTNDVTQIEMFIAMGLQMLIKSPIMAIWAISKILNKSIEFSMLTALGVFILLITITIILTLVLPKFEKIQKLIDKLNNVTRENLTGIRVIKAFNAEDFEQDRFENVNEELTKTHLFNQRCFAILNPVMNIVMHFLTLGIYFVGAILINKANILDKINLFSNMVVFTSYGMQVIMSFLMLAMLFMILPRAQVSAKRINEVLDKKITIKDGNVKESEPFKTVEFKNVYFKYPDADEYLLEDISFKANKGETVAFIGSTGSGKSTLINLIPRFYDVTEGSILVDDVDVKDYKLDVLHSKIGYVSQKPFMFTGSVLENVSYGDNLSGDITKEDVKKAIEVAQASDFVNKMENGYESHIARGGTNISGGQKQRLSIARAIAYNPEIYIFDDSFSALDYKTDAALRSALKEYTKDATCLIVAQRIGTIMNADKIIVLDKGKCVGVGTHKELLKNCEVYKEIALSQLSEEELNEG
ncbi:MAG: ABC transporter ATP-binding protein [Firmicutes bacterium]|nr:ABC transporter ATP-binding protein [Bacillota bacterium]